MGERRIVATHVTDVWSTLVSFLGALPCITATRVLIDGSKVGCSNSELMNAGIFTVISLTNYVCH